MSRAHDDEFLSQQGTILKQLAHALVEATPEWWTEATLELEMGDEGCAHVISSAAHPDDIVTPTDALFAQTFALQNLFEAKSQLFKKGCHPRLPRRARWSGVVEIQSQIHVLR